MIGDPHRPGEPPRLLTGNQAVARGAIEAGVHMITGYPGTPTSKVIEILQKDHSHSVTAEWQVNEKVAFEMAAAAAWSGKRAMVTMKMSGLNVASDPVLSVAFSGTKGGLVVYVGDDPNVYYGMVEQDSRYYALMASVPVLEPSDPREVLDYTRRAFALSEAIGGLVILRLTTFVANSLAPVPVGPIKSMIVKPKMDYDIDRYVKAGSARCLAQHRAVLERLEKARSEAVSLSRVADGEGPFGIVAVGVGIRYVEELRRNRGLDLPSFYLGMSSPLPEKNLSDFLKPLKQILVVEESEPIVENQVGALIAREGRRVRLFGKGTGTFSKVGDFDPDIVERAVSSLIYRPVPRRGLPSKITARAAEISPHRVFTFCPGCPHRGTFLAINRAIEKSGYGPREVIVTGDIGCTILGVNPPFSTCWTEVVMGASLGLAQGYKAAGIKTPVIATIGDGTFFHAGLPSLLNAVHRKTSMVVVIMDNRWMSMTGYQPHIGSKVDGGLKPIKLKEVIKGLGVTWLKVVNPYLKGRMTRLLRRALKRRGVSVIIARRECAVMADKKILIPAKIRKRRCRKHYGRDENCPVCLSVVGCPAIMADGERVWIDTELCKGCWLCLDACPHGAVGRDFKHIRIGGRR